MQVVNNHNRAFGRCTLREVAMPGSHNAGTAALTRRISKHAPTIYKAVPGFIRRWSVCQSLTVGEQLRAGSRYIDIRSAVTSDGKVVYVHANVGRPVEEALSDIGEFINTTTHEVVIVDFQHFYNFRDSDHDAYAEKIRSIFDHERIADKKTYQGSLEQMRKAIGALLCSTLTFRLLLTASFLVLLLFIVRGLATESFLMQVRAASLKKCWRTT